MYCMCVCVHRDLKLDVIPREATGEIINPTDASIVHLYKRVSPSADLPGVCGVGIPPVSGGGGQTVLWRWQSGMTKYHVSCVNTLTISFPHFSFLSAHLRAIYVIPTTHSCSPA